MKKDDLIYMDWVSIVEKIICIIVACVFIGAFYLELL